MNVETPAACLDWQTAWQGQPQSSNAGSKDDRGTLESFPSHHSHHLKDLFILLLLELPYIGVLLLVFKHLQAC